MVAQLRTRVVMLRSSLRNVDKFAELPVAKLTLAQLSDFGSKLSKEDSLVKCVRIAIGALHPCEDSKPNQTSQWVSCRAPISVSRSHCVSPQCLNALSPAPPPPCIHFVFSPSSFRSAQFLHHEVPIRLARRVRALSSPLWPTACHDSVWGVQQVLIESIERLATFPRPQSVAMVSEFQRLHMAVRAGHKNSYRLMTNALGHLPTFPEPAELTGLLDNFYGSRIGIRLLVDQHVALAQPQDGFVGVIKEECVVKEVIQDAVDAALSLHAHEEAVPEVILRGNDVTIRYVPQHIQLIVFELFKNALTASLEHARAQGVAPPAIEITTSGGSEDVAIKISDRGGGFKRSDRSKFFSYAFSTVDAGPQYDPVAASIAYVPPSHWHWSALWRTTCTCTSYVAHCCLFTFCFAHCEYFCPSFTVLNGSMHALRHSFLWIFVSLRQST